MNFDKCLFVLFPRKSNLKMKSGLSKAMMEMVVMGDLVENVQGCV